MKRLISFLVLMCIAIGFSGCSIHVQDKQDKYWSMFFKDNQNTTWESSDGHIWFSYIVKTDGSVTTSSTNGQCNYNGIITNIIMAGGDSSQMLTSKFPRSFYLYPYDDPNAMKSGSGALLAGDLMFTTNLKKFVVSNINVNKLSDENITQLTFSIVSTPPTWATTLPAS